MKKWLGKSLKKTHSKLIASGFLLLVALILVVTTSYAWMTLSDSPALTGVQINIGGSNTIKIAPDVTEEMDDGTMVHYPGLFQENFDFSQYKEYSYLKNLYGLTPVSTADGIHWFMPKEDAQLEIKGNSSLADFAVDKTLSHANILTTSDDADALAEGGSYVYVDFWLVAPMDCNVRVSIGSADEGSYLIGLPEVVSDVTTDTGFSLEQEPGQVDTCARVGFLTNTDTVDEKAAMEAYKDSDCYSNNYKSLKGIYQESDVVADEELEYDFLIYEPNGLVHDEEGVSYILGKDGLTYVSCSNGEYAYTKPIGYDADGNVALMDISDELTVQLENSWKLAGEGQTMISQIFQSMIYDQDLTGMSEDEVAQLFYAKMMQKGFSEYVNRGKFFQSTKMLYYAGNGTTATENGMNTLTRSETTSEAVIVKLERDVPQRVRMYVWLEGQDVDCVRQAASEYFALGIELAGSTQD